MCVDISVHSRSIISFPGPPSLVISAQGKKHGMYALGVLGGSHGTRFILAERYGLSAVSAKFGRRDDWTVRTIEDEYTYGCAVPTVRLARVFHHAVFVASYRLTLPQLSYILA